MMENACIVQSQMVKAQRAILTEMYTREIGSTARDMVKVFTGGRMVVNIGAPTLMTESMAKESKDGRMDASTKVSIRMVELKDKARRRGLTDVSTPEHGLTFRCRVMGFTP